MGYRDRDRYREDWFVRASNFERREKFRFFFLSLEQRYFFSTSFEPVISSFSLFHLLPISAKRKLLLFLKNTDQYILLSLFAAYYHCKVFWKKKLCFSKKMIIFPIGIGIILVFGRMIEFFSSQNNHWLKLTTFDLNWVALRKKKLILFLYKTKQNKYIKLLLRKIRRILVRSVQTFWQVESKWHLSLSKGRLVLFGA